MNKYLLLFHNLFIPVAQQCQTASYEEHWLVWFVGSQFLQTAPNLCQQSCCKAGFTRTQVQVASPNTRVRVNMSLLVFQQQLFTMLWVLYECGYF